MSDEIPKGYMTKGKAAKLVLTGILATAAIMLAVIYLPQSAIPLIGDDFVPSASVVVNGQYQYSDCEVTIDVCEEMYLYITDNNGNVLRTIDLNDGGVHDRYHIKESCTIHILVPGDGGIRTKLEKIQ